MQDKDKEGDANYFAASSAENNNSENIDVSRCPTAKEEVPTSYAHKTVEADSTMQQPEQAKNIVIIEKTETKSSLPSSSSQQTKVIQK